MEEPKIWSAADITDLFQRFKLVPQEFVNVHDYARLLEENKRIKDAAEMLWVVVANVSGSDWTKQTVEWQEAAACWRDNYFESCTRI